jgi:hypothetical protein
MSALGLRIIDKSVQDANGWLRDLMAALGWEDNHRAYRLLRSTLQIAAGLSARVIADLSLRIPHSREVAWRTFDSTSGSQIFAPFGVLHLIVVKHADGARSSDSLASLDGCQSPRRAGRAEWAPWPWKHSEPWNNPAALFEDRAAAGRRLAARLAALKPVSPLVLGMVRGGIPVAFEVARALDAPLIPVVVQKMPGRCAVSAINRDARRVTGLAGAVDR